MIDYQRMFARDDGERTAYPITFGDRRPDVEYVVSEDIELAVNVALATGRPLLVLGAPGSGKTSLGFAVARRLAWDEYGFVVTSRTRAQDLLWTFDNVRRLSHALGPDADDGGTKSDERYLRPGVLWWALAPERAAAIVAAQGRPVPSSFTDGAVVVIDEIDKADPGVPNDLLRPLGDLTFEAIDVFHEQVTRQRARPPLVVITSNGERTLAPAFVRRCVVIELAGYDRDRLLAIAAAHFPGLTAALIANTLDHLIAFEPEGRPGPSRHRHRRVPRPPARRSRARHRSRLPAVADPGGGGRVEATGTDRVAVRGEIGVADLLVAIGRLGLDDDRRLRRVAELLALRPPEATVAPHSPGDGTVRERPARQEPVVTPAPTDAVVDAPRRELPVVVHDETAGVIERVAWPVNLPDAPSSIDTAGPRAPAPPLFARRQERSIVQLLLSSRQARGDLDVDAVLEDCARLQLADPLPELTEWTVHPGVDLLVDVSGAIAPYDDDVDRLVRTAEQIGGEAARVFYFEHCPGRGTFSDGDDTFRAERRTVVAGAFGFGAALRTAGADEWRTALEALRARTTVVGLCPFARARAEFGRTIPMVPWTEVATTTGVTRVLRAW